LELLDGSHDGMNKTEFLSYLRSLVTDAGSQKALAKRLEINEAYLSDILAERREPAEKILSALGMEKVVTYHFVSKK
jgi:hypothetical protein